jgi:hypothetical protein
VAMTFGQHVNQLLALYPQCDSRTAESMVWQAFLMVYSEHPWIFCIKESRVVTEPSYSSGQVTITNNSTAIVLNNDGSSAWDPAWTQRRFICSDRAEEYDITITSPTTATLGATWPGATNATANYTIFRDTYPLPADCDFGREYFILDPTNNRALRIKDFGVFVERKIRGTVGPGTPCWVTRGPMTAAGVAQIRFGTDVPSDSSAYPLYYFATPTKPTTYNTVIQPAFPGSHEDLLWRRSRWLYAEERRRWKERDYLRGVYYERFFDAVKLFDGGPEVERRIRGTFPWVGDLGGSAGLAYSALRGSYTP